ncbi:MAG: hypothetical protein P4L92_03285 [Rudaea sp.]|nr:hypothetical protein [Rudaea sp.]
MNAGSGSNVAFAAPRWHWLTTLMLAALVALMIVGAMEIHWRALGYQPNIRDSSELWSIQRDRVYSTKKIPLVLLGASRIEFAIDMKLLKQLLPDYRAVMLAQNAHYPLAALRDLAADDRFHGVVLCDIESRGLYKMFTDMQQPLVDYYHRQWSPSWHVHRAMLSLWQAYFDVADPQLGAIAALRRWIDGSPPPAPDYFRFHADRSGDIDYTLTDAAAAKRHFEQLVGDTKDIRALVPPDQWLADLGDVYEWTKQIQARGGKVIFYQSPTSGAVRETDAIAHPKALYWDRFAANAPAVGVIDAEDDPSLSAFPLPDDSHMDFRDKAGYTRALVDALVGRGLVAR